MAQQTFAQVFMINRVVKLIAKHTDIDIPSLPSQEQHTRAKEIVKCLLDDGILHYMKTKYKHNDINVITSLFNSIIGKYSKQYKLIISYEKNCINTGHNDNAGHYNSRYYERKIFDQTDLIPKTFQFLQLIDINQCCLVNSSWLYHGYNINSIYYINFATCMKIITQSDSTTNINNLEQKKRFLQRCINIRKFKYSSWANGELSQSFIDQFKQFYNIEHIEIAIKKYGEKERQIIDIISKHSKKLKTFDCGFESKSDMMKWNSNHKQLDMAPDKNDDNYNLPTFYLNNCEKIDLKGLLFPIIFTNKCNVLILNYCNKTSKQWCRNVINNCDFDNIKCIWLNNVSFDKNINNNDTKILINQITSKCNNLERFIVSDPTEDILLMWKGLIPTIKKNNVGVEIMPFAFASFQNLDADTCDKLYQLLDDDNYKNECGIKGLVLVMERKSCIFYKKLLAMKNIESRLESLIVTLHWDCTKKELFAVKKMYEKYQNLLLYSITADHDDIDINFLEIMVLLNIYTTSKESEKKCFVKLDWNFMPIDDTDFSGPPMYWYGSDFELLVEWFLEKMVVNMIDNQIPMELDIRFETRFVSKQDKAYKQDAYLKTMNEISKIFLSVFSKYINIEVTKTVDIYKMQSNNNTYINIYNSKYKHPKCNKYCKFLPVPVFEFSVYDIKTQAFSEDDVLLANLKIQTALAETDFP